LLVFSLRCLYCIPVKGGLSKGCQCHTTNNWKKRQHNPRRRQLQNHSFVREKARSKKRFYHIAESCVVTIGFRVEQKLTSPRKIAERRTEKKGSMALIVCVNDTATFPRLMFVKRLPMVWTIARGRIARSWETRTAPTLILMHYVYTESLPDKTKCSPGHQKSLAF
jgi:hypothetical protein